MIYRQNAKNSDEISQLGLGCMRFPKKGNQIDIVKSTEIVKKAIECGINYFDTAYIYPGSEEALGTILNISGLRDKVKLATKLPIPPLKSSSDFDRIFEIQLKRLKTDRIDYYLIHMLCDTNTWQKLVNMGITDWIKKKKESGKIINIGFSYHGGRAEFKNVVDAYPWDFCMIQYNYLDVNNQAGREGLRYANKAGLPVFIMEPLRGGMLVNSIPEKAKEIFFKHNNNRSLVEWAFKWLFNQPEVTMVLSGMNDLVQIENNVKTASENDINNLSEEELLIYDNVINEINKTVKIPCTGCGYCMPCPQGVDIPTCFSCYNETYTNKYITGMKHYFMTTGAMSDKQSYSSLCVHCKKCQSHCPQSIDISNRMHDVKNRMESFWFRPVTSLAKKIMSKMK